jgi:hypothetical protein
MEASAMCFVTGIANEHVAYWSLSPLFCEFVERTYWLYCGMRRQGKLNQWEYTVKLYGVWSQRRKMHDLDAEYRTLTDKLTKASKESAPIKPIGV